MDIDDFYNSLPISSRKECLSGDVQFNFDDIDFFFYENSKKIINLISYEIRLGSGLMISDFLGEYPESKKMILSMILCYLYIKADQEFI